ncbi:GumC family protein [Novosphingobium terrae]|uniref:GumC family protein n=1 Tax=Novosphingobium terrae TaxID=2726189 RepID=UPI001980F8BD|nr:polysaccharide biosynthesis tyrosine autokinase [Novosphingobium terrae]
MKVSTASYEARLADVMAKTRDVLYRRYKTLLAITLLITLAGVAITFLIKPSYQGVTRIQIDPKQNPLAHNNPGDAQADLATEAIETEVSVINSLDTAREVVRRLKLVNDDEYNTDATSKPGLTEEQKLDATATTLGNKLDVAREKLTYIISIKVASRDPEKAARIANAFSSVYMDTKVGTNIGTASKQAGFFEQQLDQMGNDVRAADEKVAQFGAKAGIVRTNDHTEETITDQQVSPLSLQLASAESVAAEARSKQISAQQQIASGHLDSISDVRNSVTIQDLRRQRATLIQTLGEMATRYGPRYPDYIKTNKQLADVDAQLAAEQERVVRSLKSDADAAEAHAGSLQASMQKLVDKQAQEARDSVTLASLQRDADSKHAAYDRMAQTTMDARQAAQNSIAQARVIDAAKTPIDPYWPKKGLLIALSVLLGAGLGVVVITVQELMVTGMMTAAQVEDELGLPLIAAIPLLRGTDMPADMLVEKPTSQFAEAFRNARASLMGVKGELAPKVIAVTSSLPSEGKTTTALALARTMALNGQRTVIFDVDVRRAQLRNIIDSDTTGPGTVELLSGEATLDQAIQPTRLEALNSISVQKPYFTSDNLFGTQAIHDLIEGLTGRYDVIILDLPPLVGLADGRFLAALADAVVLAIKWNATPSQAVSSAVGWLRADGANLVGAMYTMVDAKSQTYGSYYYHSSKYNEYYNEKP